MRASGATETQNMISFVLFCLLITFCHGSPAGYSFEWQDVLYKFVPEAYDIRTWPEAEEICQREESGHLLSMRDPSEEAWINSKLQYLQTLHTNLGHFWLGAVDSRVRGVYEYSDGVQFKMLEANWGDGEPNRPRSVNYEHCIALNSTIMPARFYDFDCYEAFGYICKTEGIPRRLSEAKRFGYEFTWNKFVYKYVILVYDWLSWHDAEMYCRDSEVGHLASQTTTEDAKNLTRYVKMLRRFAGFRKIWIGAKANETGDGYTWTDRKPFAFTSWAPGQPRDSKRNRCTAILSFPFFGKWTNENCAEKLPFICKTRICPGKIDLVFVVDSSGSVELKGFNRAKDFIWQVVRHFNIQGGDAQVGVIRFSTRASLEIQFNQYKNHQMLRQAISNISYVEGLTITYRGLRMARVKLFSKDGAARDGAAKVLVLLTDGRSHSKYWTNKAATMLKDAGIYVVAVGIGDEVDAEELRLVSSSPNDIINVRSYKTLRKQVANIRDILCARMDPDYHQYLLDTKHRAQS